MDEEPPGFRELDERPFHARVPLEFIRQVFRVIADTPQHTYLVLTKRSTRLRRLADSLDWPPNLWMGVSVENGELLYRVNDLREVPAGVRFLSCQPLLGPLDGLDLGGIGWVIAGGESGPRHRPVEAGWVQEIRDLCTAGNVPFFFKQWQEIIDLPRPFFTTDHLGSVASGSTFAVSELV